MDRSADKVSSYGQLHAIVLTSCYYRDEPIQKLDVNSFRVHDNESEVSHENHSASIVNSDASASEPARSELATHRVSFEDQGSASIVRTQDRLLERMVDISTTSSSHASIDCIPSTPISNICIQAGVHPGDFGSDEGVLNEAPSVVVENAITQERNMLRQELDSLKQQLVGYNSSRHRTILICSIRNTKIEAGSRSQCLQLSIDGESNFGKALHQAPSVWNGHV